MVLSILLMDPQFVARLIVKPERYRLGENK